jgi:hypothetical protein
MELMSKFTRNGCTEIYGKEAVEINFISYNTIPQLKRTFTSGVMNKDADED